MCPGRGTAKCDSPIWSADEKRRPAWGTGGAGAVASLGGDEKHSKNGSARQGLPGCRDRLVTMKVRTLAREIASSSHDTIWLEGTRLILGVSRMPLYWTIDSKERLFAAHPACRTIASTQSSGLSATLPLSIGL